MFVNTTTREINVRIVYCGATGSGAAENLRGLHPRLAPESRGRIVTSEAGPRRVTFFDFLPEGLGQVRGFTIRVHLYALDSDDTHVDDCDLSAFQDVDGVVFVADPRPERLAANIAGLERVGRSLATRGYAWETMPVAFQVLHREAEASFDGRELRDALAPGDRPWNEARAVDGGGVFDTVKAILRVTLTAMAAGRLREWVDPEKQR
jgi:hypothetical protein